MARRTFYARYGKRLLDVVIAGTALVVFAPILVIVAILVRIKLGSPVLFRQPRPGENGAIFNLVKFRTMIDAVDAKGNPLPDDQRLTRFGKILRGTSLDELPELLNILRGDMSLVGPRPLLVSYLPHYTPREQTRHDVRPGLTGWAQINGRVNIPWDEGLEMDAWYVENMSLGLDLKILWLTFWKVIRRDDVHPSDAGARPNLDDERRMRHAPKITPSVMDLAVAEMKVLSLADADEWHKALGRIPNYDVYHLPEYHRIAEERGEGRARFFVYHDGEFTLALPLLLRPLEGERWLENGDRQWQDATSVYGYVGPLASHDSIPNDVRTGFQRALTASLRKERVVTLFSRLHPFLPQTPLLAGLGTCASVGRTVSIDLTMPEADFEKTFNSNHRQDIRHLRNLGACTIIDETGEYLEAFVEMYHATMCRVNAASHYFFDRAYFEALRRELGERCRLHVVLLENRPIAGGVVLAHSPWLQYHLCGTADYFVPQSPTKILLADIAKWGREHGFRRLHLGGGKGSKQDTLFRFKAGFSDDRHDFTIWRWVLDGPEYQRLCDLKQRWNGTQGLRVTASEYFPAFRSPVETS